eukprot:4637143-Pleurochrysis_carterae.AAC.1
MSALTHGVECIPTAATDYGAAAPAPRTTHRRAPRPKTAQTFAQRSARTLGRTCALATARPVGARTPQRQRLKAPPAWTRARAKTPPLRRERVVVWPTAVVRVSARVSLRVSARVSLLECVRMWEWSRKD